MSKSRRTSDLVNSLLVNADNSVNIHEGTQSPYFQLDTAATPTLQPGMFGWNDADGTVDLRLKGNNVTLQVGQETLARVVNKTGADLLESQYKVVRVRIASEGGAQGQRLAVVLAQGNNDPDSVTTLGLVTENIANNQEGFITIFGNVNGINTTGSLQGETWVDGDVLYLSPTTPGGLTKVKPTAPDHTVTVGYVVYAHANQGKIFVKVDNGYELDELHNVKITSVANNDLLQYDSTQQVWKNVAASVAIPTPTLAQVTTAGNTTTNAITVGALNVNISGVDRVKLGTGLIEIYDSGNTRRFFAGTSGPNGQLLIDSGGSWDVNFLGGGFKYLRTGNFGIGTTTDAGYKLDVNGSAAVRSGLTLFGETYLTQDGITAKFSSKLGIFQFDRWQSGPVTAMYINGWGNYTYLNTALNLGTNSTTVESMLSVYGSRTAASAIARGVYFNNTLVAAANNDVLVGLDINPTFTLGGLTGVSRVGARIQNGALLIGTTLLNTDTLSFPLQINGSSQNIGSVFRNALSTGYTSFRFYNDQNVNTRAMEMGYAGSAYPSAILTGGVTGESAYLTSTGAYPLQLGTNNTARFIIFSNGNVAINTATDAGYKLDVNGTLRVSGVASLTSIINQSTLVDGATFNADTNVITITGGRGNNNLGVLNISTTIGSFAPNFGGDKNMVNIGGNFTVGSSATGNVNFLAINPTINYPVGSSGIQRGIYLNPTLTRVTDYRAIEVVTGNVIFGSTSGSVGIGTTTPNYILDVYQTNVKAQIRSTGENQNATLFLGTPFGGTSSPKVAIIARAKTSWSRADLAFCLNDNQSSNSVEATISDLRMVILSDGKVGVNVANPTYQFQVSGDIALSGNLVPTAGSQTLGTFTNRFGDVWAGGLIVGSTFYGDNHQSASGTLYFKDGGGVEKMRMTSVGNFLIGTTTDTGEKLQVNGTVRASAFAIGATAGWTGTINIPTNPPGQQNIDVQGGIIVNVY